MQKITPCLWFDKNCEEAINFYTSVFPNSKISSILRYPSDMQVGPMTDMAGKVLTAVFELNGLAFQALDGGPLFKINPSINFMVNFDPSRDADAAAHLDDLWAKLSEGGSALMPIGEYPFSKRYGWIQDRFGVSWQLILTNPEGEPRPNIIPSMLFVGDVCGKAEEALNFYASLFKNSRMGTVAHYPAGMEPDKAGTAMFAEASLSGEWLVAMDSARMHDFSFNEGVSLSIDCADQAEVDYFWNKLTEEGEESMCGWLKDKYGVSWQVAPHVLVDYMTDPDQEKVKRVTAAFMKMKKFDIAKLQAAYEGKM
ncbi:VOC family protein [Candidatus Uhrbacteria bacterium]|nr:MAG: VOC family protein [Candidatus Uhrbacteria bacterium]